MAKLNGSFSGVVTAMNDNEAQVRLQSVHMWDENAQASAKAGDEVSVFRVNFMEQAPYPSQGSHVEGRLEHDTVTGQEQFLNLVRPV
jgi:hypothetical protein